MIPHKQLQAFSRFVLVFIIICPHALKAQDWPIAAQIIETDEYQVSYESTEKSLEALALTLQDKKKKVNLNEEKAIIEMDYSVYEDAMVGTRPFGKIRYQIILELLNEELICTFQDFTFRKIERNPRYGKLEEVKGRPKPLSSIHGKLNEVQIGIVRWKTESVIKSKLALLQGDTLASTE
ncbi:MAG: hypothetical protein RJQ09_11755 [Cyclobacteriaceae bacterium]